MTLQTDEGDDWLFQKLIGSKLAYRSFRWGKAEKTTTFSLTKCMETVQIIIADVPSHDILDYFYQSENAFK